MAAASGSTTHDPWDVDMPTTRRPGIGAVLRVQAPVPAASPSRAEDPIAFVGTPASTPGFDDQRSFIDVRASSSTSASTASTDHTGHRDDDGKGGASAPGPDVTSHFKAWASRDKYLLLHKLIYWIGMGANASYYPFIVMRQSEIGIDGFQSGMMLAASHIAALVSAPALSALADRGEKWRRLVLVGGAAGCAVCFAVLMPRASSFWECLAVQVLAETFYAAVWPIVDASLMALLQATEGDTASYGNSRAWGAAGWGIHAAIGGAIYDRYGLASSMFNTYAVMVLPLFPLLTLLPLEKRGATHSSVKGAWRRLATLDVAVFLLVVCILAALLFVVDTYRLPYLATLGADNTLLGLSVTMTSVSEVPCFFLASAVLKRVSMPTVLLVVLVAYALRFVWYATMTVPSWTMPMELLHGAQFAFGWAASTAYVASLLPPELSSIAQGLLGAVQWGLGSAFGSLAGGYVYARHGGRTLMWDCAALSGIGVAIMMVSMWHSRKLRLAATAADKQADTEIGKSESLGNGQSM